MNRFRRVLIRWEKKVENYFGMLHFVCENGGGIVQRGAGGVGDTRFVSYLPPALLSMA
jgi:hypothetical protein